MWKWPPQKGGYYGSLYLLNSILKWFKQPILLVTTRYELWCFFSCRIPKIQCVIVVIASVTGIVFWWPALSWSHTTDKSRRVRSCHSLYRGTWTEVSALQAYPPILSRSLWSDTQLFNLSLSRFSHLQYLVVYWYGISRSCHHNVVQICCHIKILNYHK